MFGSRYAIFRPRRRRWPRIILGIVLAVALALILLGIYTVIDNGRVVVKTQKVLVSSLPQALEGFTVLHVSDLNGKRFGPGQKQLAAALQDKRYHAILATGNMVGPSGDTGPFVELLSALDTTKPAYFVAGNADPAAIGGQTAGQRSTLAEWVTTIKQTRGATFVDAPARLSVGTSTVWFTDASQLALDLDSAASALTQANTAIALHQADIIEQTKAARGQMQTDDLHITLASKPMSEEMVMRMQGSGDASAFIRTVDLILAGGTCGGQWRLPGIGPLWADGWRPSADRVSGYHYAGSVSLVQAISGGLGVDPQSPLPPFRLFCPPEVTLITFTGEMDRDVLPG